MDFMSSLAVLLAGGLIGATGIGGVLLVPALTQLEGMPLAEAVAASSMAFAFPAFAALWWLRSAPPVGAKRLWALVVGAATGALLGGLLVHQVDANWLLSALAVLSIGSGLKGLMPQPSHVVEHHGLAALPLVGIGLMVGLGSGLTGTGGPVILIPLMMLCRQPFALTIAAVQAIQLPVALCATAAHAASGTRNLMLACTLGLILLVGSLVGQQLARRANMRALQIVVCLMLLFTGIWFAWKAVNGI